MRKDMATKKNMLKHSAVENGLCAYEPDLPGRKAVGVDPEIKASNLRRLRRIEGQIRGLQRMVEEDRYCADILTQVSSAQEALRAVARALMRNHLTHCAAQAIRTGSAEERQAMYDELLEMIYKNAR
jgi:DNA-binding FrmR family transcriptional regulator